MNKKRELLIITSEIIFGIIIGLIAKYSNEVFGNTFYDKIFHSIDLVTAGLFIWLVLCYIITNISENKYLATLNVITFLTFMMIAYYLYCYFILNYFPYKKIIFWSLMLIPCGLLAYFAKTINKTKKIKITFFIIGVLIMTIDIMFLKFEVR